MPFNRFQGLERPLQLGSVLTINNNLVVNGDLNCSGEIDASGIAIGNLTTNNTWTNTNSYTQPPIFPTPGAGSDEVAIPATADARYTAAKNTIIGGATFTEKQSASQYPQSSLAAPTGDQMLNKSVADGLIAGASTTLLGADNDFLGQNDFSGNTVSCAVAATSDSHLVNKAYVDLAITNFNSSDNEVKILEYQRGSSNFTTLYVQQSDIQGYTSMQIYLLGSGGQAPSADSGKFGRGGAGGLLVCDCMVQDFFPSDWGSDTPFQIGIADPSVSQQSGGSKQYRTYAVVYPFWSIRESTTYNNNYIGSVFLAGESGLPDNTQGTEAPGSSAFSTGYLSSVDFALSQTHHQSTWGTASGQVDSADVPTGVAPYSRNPCNFSNYGLGDISDGTGQGLAYTGTSGYAMIVLYK